MLGYLARPARPERHRARRPGRRVRDDRAHRRTGRGGDRPGRGPGRPGDVGSAAARPCGAPWRPSAPTERHRHQRRRHRAAAAPRPRPERPARRPAPAVPARDFPPAACCREGPCHRRRPRLRRRGQGDDRGLALRAARTDARDAADDRGRPVQAVVRFNGGAQAAHHVLGRRRARRTRSPSSARARFTPGTRTFLSRFMLVDPLALVAEAEHLAQLRRHRPVRPARDRPRTRCSPPPTTGPPTGPGSRRAATGRHGSCGMGIGETARLRARPPARRPAGRLTRAPRASCSPSSPGSVTGSPTNCPAPPGGPPRRTPRGRLPRLRRAG